MLLEEFEAGQAVIEPHDDGVASQAFEVCQTLIYCFNGEIVDRVKVQEGVTEGGYLSSLNGKNPWYIYRYKGKKVAVMLATIGAAKAVGQLEELKALGFERFIVLGSCGVLDNSLAADRLILPSSALRDEGTSYHYAPASDEISYDDRLLTQMETILDKHGLEHVRAKTWTTDAFYRETPDKVKRRLAAGAEVVDMEASALMAWAQFREVQVYQFFYTADYVNHVDVAWDKRMDQRQSDVMTFFDIAFLLADGLDEAASL